MVCLDCLCGLIGLTPGIYYGSQLSMATVILLHYETFKNFTFFFLLGKKRKVTLLPLTSHIMVVWGDFLKEVKIV